MTAIDLKVQKERKRRENYKHQRRRISAELQCLTAHYTSEICVISIDMGEEYYLSFGNDEFIARRRRRRIKNGPLDWHKTNLKFSRVVTNIEGRCDAISRILIRLFENLI